MNILCFCNYNLWPIYTIGHAADCFVCSSIENSIGLKRIIISELIVRLAPLNMFMPSSDFFTDCSEGMLLLWILLLFMFHVCHYYTVLSVPTILVITCWESDDLLSLLCMMFPCVLSLSHMVSQIRCGTSLYWYLIFAFLNFTVIHDLLCGVKCISHF